jgi:hypothetical protein
MIADEIKQLLDEHFRWLKNKTILKSIDKDWVEITTPYLDRHNDCLQIFVRKESSGYELTDDGYVLADLESSGCTIDTPKRQELLNTTLSGFGVQLKDGQLTIRATSESFAAKKHNIVQAMLAVNDLFYLASPYVTSLFMEDVTQWLDLTEIRYTPKIKFTGRSGYDHMFDFVIPKSKSQPERIVQTLSNPKKDSAESLVFKWLDTKDTRAADTSLFVFLNDTNASVSDNVIEALNNYNLNPVLWSQRERIESLLIA